MSLWHSSLLPLSDPPIQWIKLAKLTSADTDLPDERFLSITGDDIRSLTQHAFRQISHFLRSDHLAQLRSIVDDPEASSNDRGVAIDLLKNASVSASGVLPMCQDTGTAMVYAKKGHRVITDGLDDKYIEEGIRAAFEQSNLRYSQLAPLTTWEEKNTGTNLPAEIDIQAAQGDSLEFLFIAKGGGSANKTFLFQETKALLQEEKFLSFVAEKLAAIGTTACPPYHLAVVIGGPSADFTVKTAKLAAARALDTLPTTGSESGSGFRDVDLEAKVLRVSQELGIGAQFGGKYFCHDVRVIRLPRHTGSLPIAIAVSCSADRQAYGRISRKGIFFEKLESDPAQFLPDIVDQNSPADAQTKRINLNQPMDLLRAELSNLSVGERVLLNGRMVVARDLAHAEVRSALEKGKPVPSYLVNHPIYYAAPAKTPEGLASGSFGPTTAGRMDSYVRELQERGASLVMLAKGNRSAEVTESCAEFGGFYLATVGGPAALIAQDHITHVEVIDFPHLGLEAVYVIDVVDFPAYLVVDNKGNDFFSPPGGKTIRLGPTRVKDNS